MTIKEFIEKAVQGGWQQPDLSQVEHYDGVPLSRDFFLDPLAWQAVGKVEGWTEYPTIRDVIGDSWKDYMHRMIDALADGKTIEQFLATL